MPVQPARSRLRCGREPLAHTVVGPFSSLTSSGDIERRFSVTKVVESIDVEVPVRTVYNQWTQFEEFPRFMEGVESVKQIDDTRLHWVAEVAGKRKEWDAKITEQIPDERVAWTSTSGAKSAGVVTFHRLGENRTRVTLQMEVDPEGPIENAGAALGVLQRQVKADLERFKKFIEERGRETGAWRGEVRQEQTTRSTR
jgi:uncharacterized membrane protein